jgi:serine/threonine-protein kinase
MTIIAKGQVIAGKLRLERPLARGGMGSVWVAHHLQLDTPVAVKFMHPALTASESARTRFEREARACAQLQSPHVVRVSDYGVEDDMPYIVMELLQGEDLGQRLRREGRLTIADAARILDPICKALRRAHEMGLVHRDLKPGNIFLARHDDEEIVKVLDFGIAKAITPAAPPQTSVSPAAVTQGAGVTGSGNLLGSPLYMSPEQIRKSKEVDHRSDLWSVGVILYQALTGRTPFVEDEIGAVLVAICTEPIPRPSSIAPDLGPAVDRFFERALAREPSERFQNARELCDAFTAMAREEEAKPRTNDTATQTPVVTDERALAATLEATPADIIPAPPKMPVERWGLRSDEPSSASKPPAVNVSDSGAVPGAQDGTLSPSGRTQEAPASTRWARRSRFALPALLSLGIAGAGWLFLHGAGAEHATREDGPGSPTLPLPPPTATPVANVPSAAPAKEITPEEPRHAAPAPSPASAEDRAAPTAAQGEKPSSEGRPASRDKRVPAPTASVHKPASPSEEARELGLE